MVYERSIPSSTSRRARPTPSATATG